VYVVLIAAFFTAALSAQNKIVIGTPGFEHPIALVMQKILPTAYSKIGYTVEFLVLPPERINKEFEAGNLDGYIFADAAYADQHSTAVRVPTSIGSDDIVVFTKRSDIAIKDWSELSQYSIGYQIGMVVVESKVKGMTKTNPAQVPPTVFQMLDAGRSDVALMPYGLGLMMLKTLGIKGVKALQPPLTQVPLYHFLIGKRAALVPKLDAVLAEMVKSGELKAVTAEVYAGFM